MTVVWGSEIAVNFSKPDWLSPSEVIVGQDRRLCAYNIDTGMPAKDYNWASLTHVLLAADHPYYKAAEAGFNYWPGGAEAPADWDEGEVLRTDKKYGTRQSRGFRRVSTGWTRTADDTAKGMERIIGYKKTPVCYACGGEVEMRRALYQRTAGPVCVDCGIPQPRTECCHQTVLEHCLGCPYRGTPQSLARAKILFDSVGATPHLSPCDTVVTTPQAGPYSIGSDLWPGLSKLIEEAGELAELMPAAMLARALGRITKVGGKVMQTGGSVDHWSGNLAGMFIEELGDLKAAIDFFIDKNPRIDGKAVDRRAFEKQVKFQRWHRENSQ